MQPWATRVTEEANLFNPAFCAMLLAKAADDFAKKARRPLPLALAFLILPIVLHPGTRSALPGSTITALLPWIQENRGHLVNFATRVQQLTTITREALLFATQHRALALDNQGGLVRGQRRLSPTEARTGLFTDDARDCLDRAAFLGRWFAAAGTIPAIYSAWGIAP